MMTRLVTKAMTVMTTVTTSWSRESHPRLAQLSHSGTGLLAQLMVCPFTLSGSFPCNFCPLLWWWGGRYLVASILAPILYSFSMKYL